MCIFGTLLVLYLFIYSWVITLSGIALTVFRKCRFSAKSPHPDHSGFCLKRQEEGLKKKLSSDVEFLAVRSLRPPALDLKTKTLLYFERLP
jgi:hypothetical protein